MTRAKVRVEDGLVVGTSGNKYESKNPIARWMLGQFDLAVRDLAARANPESILEIGCGEGHIVSLLLEATRARIHATDISPSCVAEARSQVHSDRVTFAVENVLTMAPPAARPQLVVCCEVLEHLDDPEQGLRSLLALQADLYLVSVPREPIWRMLNFARGAYVADWGNSPGHIQHWSKRGFLKFIGTRLTPVAVRTPLPWTMALCRPNGR